VLTRGLTNLLVSANLPFVETYGSAAIAALGDPTRRAIFESLARQPKAVGEIAVEFPVSRPAVSQHLRVLKEAGLVTDRAEGTKRIYQVRRQGVQAIHGYLDQMWAQAMAAFQAEGERVARAEPSPGRPQRDVPEAGTGVPARPRDRGG
jgi:DNA-binding transcriptional ArsR family regulator